VSGHGDSIREWRARKIWAEEWEEDEWEEEVFEDDSEALWEEEETGPGRSSLPNGQTC
jgi:midasin (ATPase involved in ribosome maturation)